MYNVTYSGNSVSERCGGIFISDSTTLAIADSEFSSNTIGQRAIIEILSESSVSMSGTTFNENIASAGSSVMYMSDATSVIARNCTFRKNRSINGGNTITAIFSNSLLFENCNFNANQAYKESSHIYSIFSTLTISDCEFDDSDRDTDYTNIITGGFMFLSTGSVVSISGTSFSYGDAVYGGAIYILGSADVDIQNSTFSYNNAEQGAAIHATTYNTLSISNNCIFVGNTAESKVGECLYVTNAFNTLQIDSSTFNVTNNAIYLKRTNAYINNCDFTGTSSSVSELNQYAGGIEFEEVSNGKIISSTFTSLKGRGGAFKISSNAFFKELNEDVSYTITDSTITNCMSVTHGGGIYVDTIDSLTLTNTQVRNNDASSGEGGGIYFTCYENANDNCRLILDNSSVTNNTSKIGGGIKWNYREPTVYSNSSVTGNTATIYGSNFACFAREVKELDESEYEYYTNSSNDLSATTNGSESDSLTRIDFSGVMSGGSIPTTYLALVDQYDQVVTSDGTSMIEFTVDESSVSENNQFESKVYGQTKFYPINGVYNISGLYLVADPNSNQQMNLYNYGIDVTIPIVNQFLYDLLGINLTEYYVIDMGVGLRACLEGEGLRENGACYTCPAGTYLLEVPTEPTACKECNSERAICLGGSTIGPKPGYWRKSNLTEEFQVCPVSSACLGMTAPSYNPKGDCNTGYHGTLCQGCLPGYSRAGDDQCTECPDKMLNLLRITGICVLSTILIVFMVRNILASALKPAPTSVYVKIMMNHLQLIMITASFNFDWPDNIVSFFDTVSPIATASDNLISFDCFLDTRQPGTVDLDANSAPNSEIRVEQKNVMIYLALPWLLALVTLIVWAVILKQKRKMNKLNARFLTAYIFILFLVFPSLTQIMVDQFNCQEYDGELRSRVDLQVK